MRKLTAAGGSALFFALAPGLVAVAGPWWLAGWRLRAAPAWWVPVRVLGAALAVLATGLLVSAFVRFVVEGVGTPAPVAPTQRLVVGGLYRYVRNPMYLAVVAAIVGQALWLAAPVLLGYAAVVAAAMAAFVYGYEQPVLARRYGAEYAAYRAAVPGWLPRTRPWRPEPAPEPTPAPAPAAAPTPAPAPESDGVATLSGSMLWYHELVEARHTVLNPFTEEKLALVATACRLEPGQQVLDLACGKAELLATWAHRYGVGGVGVDLSAVFLAAGQARLAELGVADRVSLVPGDAGAYRPRRRFDIAACVGATWIGGGLTGTLAMLRAAVAPGGRIVVGEPYWVDEPDAAGYQAMDSRPGEFVSLAGTLDRFERAGLDLVEMVLASPDDWDRYEARHWAAADDWLRANPGDERAGQVRELTARYRRAYLEYGRRYLGWGVFVLR